MYIIVMEDFNVYKAETITEDDMSAADDGIIDIIRVSDFTQYSEGEWIPMGDWRQLGVAS